MAFLFHSLPVSAPLRITSSFGKRDTGIKGASTFHKGADIGRDFSKAKTNILSVNPGVVTANYWNDYRGWVVVIKHDHVYSTLYQHLDQKCPYPVGSRVKAGQFLGIMGSSSNKKVLKVATHLHFELRKHGTPIDPQPYLKNIQNEVDDMTEAEVRKIAKDTILKILEGKSDAPSGWAKDFWEKAVKLGIVDGSNPQGYTTREQVATMLYKAMNEKGEPAG